MGPASIAKVNKLNQIKRQWPNRGVSKSHLAYPPTCRKLDGRRLLTGQEAPSEAGKGPVGAAEAESLTARSSWLFSSGGFTAGS